MSAAACKRSAWSALILDDSGEGLAEYSVLLAFFAVQTCICSAIALNQRIDDVIRTMQALFS